MKHLIILILSSTVAAGFEESWDAWWDQKNVSKRCESSAVADIIAKLWEPKEKYVVYRCRANEDCGGMADRMSGVLATAAFAIATNRSLRIDWPDLHKFQFDRREHPEYTPLVEKVISEFPPVFNDRIRCGVPERRCQASEDVLFMSAMNCQLAPKKSNREAWRAQPEPIIVLQINRNYGDDFVAIENGLTQQDWYACLLPYFFPKPSGSFQMLGGDVSSDRGYEARTETLRDVLSFVEGPSIGIHLRADDKEVAEAEGRRRDILRLPHNASHSRLASGRLKTKIQQIIGKKKVNCFLATNHISERHAWPAVAPLLGCSAWMAQKLGEHPHLNNKEAGRSRKVSTLHVFQSALLDWELLRLVDVIVIHAPRRSGFDMLSVASAPSRQLILRADNAHPVDLQTLFHIDTRFNSSTYPFFH